MKRYPMLAALSGAAFLMATSAIGPGFITQTTLFTARTGAAFGIVILLSILLDIIIQLNIWRIITVSGKRAQELADEVIPGAGILLTILVAGGGLAFNIGNIAGAGLGLETLAGIPVKTGAMLSALVAIALFLINGTGSALDWFSRVLGILMIALTLYVACITANPASHAIMHPAQPLHLDLLQIVTIVGGTVGGYISFAGAHRLLDAGVTGIASVKRVTQGSILGISLASLMRLLLFLATLGVVSTGFIPSAANPAASVFKEAAGAPGNAIFGFVLWSAAITSVVGSAYTSVSFLKTAHSKLKANERVVLSVFVAVSALIFFFAGQPVKILVLAGSVNGFILPFSLALMLVAARKRSKAGVFHHSPILHVAGWITACIILAIGLRLLMLS